MLCYIVRASPLGNLRTKLIRAVDYVDHVLYAVLFRFMFQRVFKVTHGFSRNLEF
jgi:hypothetical protein